MDGIDTRSGIENITSSEEYHALRSHGRFDAGNGRGYKGLRIGASCTVNMSRIKRRSGFGRAPSLEALIAALGRNTRRRNTEWNAHSRGGLAVGIFASWDPIVILVYTAVRFTRVLILTIV
jgi:hypothetical protein